MKSKKVIKENVQDVIMNTLGNVSYIINENLDITEDEKLEYLKEAKKQMDRVARMFGYEQSWFN